MSDKKFYVTVTYSGVVWASSEEEIDQQILQEIVVIDDSLGLDMDEVYEMELDE